MTPLSDNARFIVWLITGAATILVGVISIYLEEDIRYRFRRFFGKNKGGRKPSQKKKIVWIMYFSFVILAIVGAAIASVAPSSELKISTVSSDGLLIAASNQPNPGITRIIVARFENENHSDEKVTDIIVGSLRKAVQQYPDIEIVVLDKVITELEGNTYATKIGQIYGASIVIWGWYSQRENRIPIGIHFEIISSSAAFNKWGRCAASSSQIRQVDPIKLSDLSLQFDLSNELSFVTTFSLGLAYYGAEKTETALKMFDESIKYLGNAKVSAETVAHDLLIDEDLLYFYRGQALMSLGKYDAALVELGMASSSFRNSSVYYILSGMIYSFAEQDDKSLDAFTLAIQTSSSTEEKAMAFLSRGYVYNHVGMYDKATSDFTDAIKANEQTTIELLSFVRTPEDFVNNGDSLLLLDSNNFLGYFLRAAGNYELKNYDTSLSDFNKVLELNPGFLYARYGRYLINFNELKNNEEARKDLELLLTFDTYRTPCNLQNMGVLLYQTGDTKRANEYFNEVIALTQDTILYDPQNAYAYFVQGLAYSSLGNYSEAIRDWTLSQKLDPEKAKELGITKRIIDVIIYAYKIPLSTFSVSLILITCATIYYWKRQKKNLPLNKRKRH